MGWVMGNPISGIVSVIFSSHTMIFQWKIEALSQIKTCWMKTWIFHFQVMNQADKKALFHWWARNLFYPFDTIWCWESWSSLIQVMAWCPVGTKWSISFCFSVHVYIYIYTLVDHDGLGLLSLTSVLIWAMYSTLFVHNYLCYWVQILWSYGT